MWDSTYFPDPKRLLTWVHEQGLEIILNIHDQCGIDVCQPNYLEAANRTGIDPASSTAVPCRFLDKAYALAMSELVSLLCLPLCLLLSFSSLNVVVRVFCCLRLPSLPPCSLHRLSKVVTMHWSTTGGMISTIAWSCT